MPTKRTSKREPTKATRKHSLKRERYSKTTFLKGLKKIIPKGDLLSVYLVGSAQKGIRASSIMSDVDIVIIVPKERLEHYKSKQKGITRLNLLRTQSFLHGIHKVDVHFRTPENIHAKNKERKSQLLFGQDFLAKLSP